MLIETRTIENGVHARISAFDDKYLVAVYGTEAIPMASSCIFEPCPYEANAWMLINSYIARCFNASRMFSAPGDEENLANHLRAIEESYK